MTNEKATVFIIDDDPSASRGLTSLVEAAGMSPETYNSGETFLDLAQHDRHGCILLDVKMPGLNGLDLQAELGKRKCILPIIFISGHSDIPDATLAMKRGAVDFLTKPVDRDQLLTTISKSLRKDLENRESISQKATIQKRRDTLSPREYTILTFVISGMLNKQIAHRLGITEATVKVHRGRVMKKMQADSLVELIRFAELIEVKPAEADDS